MIDRIRVIKLGGSLLNSARLSCEFASWLGRQSSATNLIVVGGGESVNALRQQALQQPIQAEEATHWQAISWMSENTRRVSEQLQFPVATHIGDIDFHQIATWLFDVQTWMRAEWRGPCDWSVTSDSISIALATKIQAREVVLLKSTLGGLRPHCLLESLLKSDLVDDFFESAISEYRQSVKSGCLRIVNLRDESFAEIRCESA
jgi:aspartokinase-like uncharacterized kinase